jgi:hypothetical protein
MQLLSAWQAAVAELPAAVEQLAAVSFQGRVKLVCFDLEASDSEFVASVCAVLLQHSAAQRWLLWAEVPCVACNRTWQT